MLYEGFIKEVLCVEEINFADKEMVDGAKGVAMVAAYLEGANPKLMEFARILECDPAELEEVYVNLTVNGAWSRARDLRNDPILLSVATPKMAPRGLSKDELATKQRTAWSYLVGQAQGLTFVGLNRYPDFNK